MQRVSEGLARLLSSGFVLVNLPRSAGTVHDAGVETFPAMLSIDGRFTARSDLPASKHADF